MSNGDNAAAFDVELIAHAGLVDTTQLKHLKLYRVHLILIIPTDQSSDHRMELV